MERGDAELVAAARDIILRRYRPGRHVIGAALRSRSGRIYIGVHLEAHVGRAAVCAEAVAIGTAATAESDGGIEVIVAVRHPGTETTDPTPVLVPPCGICRELISDYDSLAEVILDGPDGIRRIGISALLPNKYRRD